MKKPSLSSSIFFVYIASDYALEFVTKGTTDAVVMDNSVPRLSAFTVCFWMKTSDTANHGTPFSYVVQGRQNELVIRNYKKFRVVIAGAVR